MAVSSIVNITGSFEAFKEALTHNHLDKQHILLYTLTPQGRVNKVLIDGFEWTFQPTENVLASTLRRHFQSAILVDAWTR